MCSRAATRRYPPETHMSEWPRAKVRSQDRHEDPTRTLSGEIQLQVFEELVGDANAHVPLLTPQDQR
jgi:hypothetical protein